MRSYPIWNVISGQGKQSSANFGANSSFRQTVFVGSGPQNSHQLANIRVEENFDRVGRVHFTLSVDGVIVKHGIFEPLTGEFTRKDVAA